MLSLVLVLGLLEKWKSVSGFQPNLSVYLSTESETGGDQRGRDMSSKQHGASSFGRTSEQEVMPSVTSDGVP